MTKLKHILVLTLLVATGASAQQAARLGAELTATAAAVISRNASEPLFIACPPNVLSPGALGGAGPIAIRRIAECYKIVLPR